MIDLHAHSTASDGSLTPTELVHRAAAAGISYFALTDHNTTKGLPEFLRAAAKTGLKPIAGAEISCELEGHELHILALNLPEKHFTQLQEIMEDQLHRLAQSRREMVERLAKAGLPLDYDAIQSAHPAGPINRAHIGLAMQRAGYVETVQQAFEQYMDEGRGFYFPAKRLEATQAVNMIGELGAVSVWAHPFFRFDTSRVRSVLEALTPLGLQGMEVYYSTYSPEQTAEAAAFADEFGLKYSAGSDYHGASKPDIQLGVGRGNLNVPDSVAEELLGI